MKISEKRFSLIYNYLLLLISICLPFGKLSNIAIIIFTIYNLIFLNRLKIDMLSIKWGMLMIIPMLLPCLFFWNNSSPFLGIKAIEKYISLLIFLFFVICNYKFVNIKFILRWYSIIMVFIILLLEVRFIITNPDLFLKYCNGIHLWEAGYMFTMSFKVHAPALNMQLAFVNIVCLWFLLQTIIIKNNIKIILFNTFIFILSFIHILIVNTRMALVCTLLCIIFMIYYELKKLYTFKKVISSILASTIIIGTLIGIAIYNNPYMIKKYTSVTFNHLDKVGKIDEFENPEEEAHNAFVTRLTMWHSAINLANRTPLIGIGSAEANEALFQYYIDTDQKFMAKHKFPVHNQYINFYLKFGVIGLVALITYLFGILYLGLKSKNSIMISFFIIFSISNMTDDFLNRFDGIGFSAFFYSIFIAYYLKEIYDKSLLNLENS